MSSLGWFLLVSHPTPRQSWSRVHHTSACFWNHPTSSILVDTASHQNCCPRCSIQPLAPRLTPVSLTLHAATPLFSLKDHPEPTPLLLRLFEALLIQSLCPPPGGAHEAQVSGPPCCPSLLLPSCPPAHPHCSLTEQPKFLRRAGLSDCSPLAWMGPRA